MDTRGPAAARLRGETRLVGAEWVEAGAVMKPEQCRWSALNLVEDHVARLGGQDATIGTPKDTAPAACPATSKPPVPPWCVP